MIPLPYSIREKVMNQSKPSEQLLSFANENAYVCSAIARLSSSLNGSLPLAEIALKLKQFLCNLNVSGFCRLSLNDQTNRFFFNSGCPLKALHTFNGINGNKIQRSGSYILFKTESVDLILNLATKTEAEIDVFIDTTAILIDVIENTISQCKTQLKLAEDRAQGLELAKLELSHSMSKIEAENTEIQKRIHQMSQNFLHGLLNKLPALALEDDQEQYLIQLVEFECYELADLAERNVASSEELSNSIKGAIHNLVESQSKTTTPISTAELLDIELF